MKKGVDKQEDFDIINIVVRQRRQELSDIAELCNGSTADSDSVCEGSNPSSAAISRCGSVW